MNNKTEDKIEHIEACAQREVIPCPANRSMHSEGPAEHWWSGWPGAYCMKCGSEDKDEICLADSCRCHCHDDFWESAANLEVNGDHRGDSICDFSSLK